MSKKPSKLQSVVCLRSSRLMHLGRWLVFGLSALLFLTACSPVYRVKYDYAIDADDQSKLCVSQCNQIRQSCQQNAQLDYQLCRLSGDTLARARHDYYHHHHGHAHADHEHSHHPHGLNDEAFHAEFFYRRNSYPQFCDVDYDTCTETYNACFQSCGGQVTSEVYCAQNCDKADVDALREHSIAPEQTEAPVPENGVDGDSEQATE